jgi:hypothetical protein
VTPTNELAYEFNDRFPSELVAGILYVSITFATAVHLCCCGCGHQVITPLRPNRWNMTFDGESVSLMPSVGNAGLPCRSHYVIRRNRIVWHDDLTLDAIARGMQRDGWLGGTVARPMSTGWRRWWPAFSTRNRRKAN